MSKKFQISLLLFLLVAMTDGVLHAQEDGERGYIEGRIHIDVNGDGVCVDSGVEGEDPLPNVNVQFTSSDGETVITHYSGESGYYGLAAAGYSYWEITVLPPEGWTVTSEPTIYVPIFDDSRSATDVHFCLSDGPVKNQGSTLLPESGAEGGNGLLLTAVFGLTILVAGAALELRHRSA